MFQRCRDDCPADRCGRHSWSWELGSPGPYGKRDRRFGSGYASADAAVEARAEVVWQHRQGTLPTDTTITVAEWVRQWLKERIAAGELHPSTARSYRDVAETHLPRIGHIRLAKLRPADLTTVYRVIVADRNAERAEAEARNAKWLAHLDPAAVRGAAPDLPNDDPPPVRRRFGCAHVSRRSGMIGVNAAPSAALPKVTKHKVIPWRPEEYGTPLAMLDPRSWLRFVREPCHAASSRNATRTLRILGVQIVSDVDGAHLLSPLASRGHRARALFRRSCGGDEATPTPSSPGACTSTAPKNRPGTSQTCSSLHSPRHAYAVDRTPRRRQGAVSGSSPLVRLDELLWRTGRHRQVPAGEP